ncbi:hypothetical protein FGIG_12284 [Fasciola gigantica]|uniref:Uncharacterized protein n=1 Tax=Fasciola gigantica TaxID=46835 RepID=A0A504YU06_FASGI|nr:hypothetical protein FGIG_12284 [Fasciola gigantica]
MNEIRMEPLTRMGVLSMLGNPTPAELKEFENQLKWMIKGWTIETGSPISNLGEGERTKVVEVLGEFLISSVPQELQSFCIIHVKSLADAT